MPREPRAHHTFDKKEFKKVDFDKRVVVYENQVDMEDLENYFGRFQSLVQTQI